MQLIFTAAKIRKTNHGRGKQGNICERSLSERKFGSLQKDHQTQTGNTEQSFWGKVVFTYMTTAFDFTQLQL